MLHNHASPTQTSLVGDCYAPRQFANLDRLDHLQAGHVYHRDIVRKAIGRQKVLLVGRERHVPNTLTHEEIFLDLMRSGIDHGYSVGWSQRDKAGLPVLGDVDAHRLNCFAAQPRNSEVDLFGDLVPDRVNDAYRAANLG